MTQAARRQYGTGTVHAAHKPGCPHKDYRDPKSGRRSVARCADEFGCRMRGSYEAGYTKGGSRRRPVVVAKTEAEVKRKLRDALAAIAAGEQASSRLTVKAWSVTWLELIVAKRRPNSYVADRAAVANWIVPTIGHRRLAELAPADVRAVSDAAIDAGRSTSTARRYQSTLGSMLTDAHEDGHPVHERVLRACHNLPEVALNDRQAFPIEDALKVLSVAAQLPHGSRWAVAFLQGMRPGEIRGMTIDGLDFERDRFRVGWQLQALPYKVTRDRRSGFRVPQRYEVRQVRGALHLVRPKTKAGHREYPMVPWVRDALEHWLAATAELDRPAGLLWPMAASDDADTAEWRALQDRAGVRHPSGRYYHRHEARHTTATLLRALKVPEHVVIAIMGHSSAASTAAYEHADDPQMLAALLGMAEQLQLT